MIELMMMMSSLGLCLCWCLVVTCVILVRRRKTPAGGGGNGGGGNGGAGNGGAGNGGAGKDYGTTGWTDGYATYYSSYPACCKEAPNYDSKAPKGECDNYSGCKHMGRFAGVNGKLTLDEVKSRNIVAFYDAKKQAGNSNAGKWWTENVKGKRLVIKDPASGKTLEVEALDTCSDGDTKNGDCTKNASKGGGYLIDLEENTAVRFWGKKQNGKLQWKWI